MGLRGFGAQPRKKVEVTAPRPRALPWKKKGLSRVQRVIAFLEYTPVTKGIYAGKRMKLLPGQRKFVEAIYGRVSKDGRRKIRIAIKSEPRGNGKTGLLAGLGILPLHLGVGAAVSAMCGHCGSLNSAHIHGTHVPGTAE